MQIKTDKTTLKALQHYKNDLEKLYQQVLKKRQKENEKLEKRKQELEIYKTEDDINDAYGYAEISATERDALILKFKEMEESNNALLNGKTVLKEYMRMLRNDIGNLEMELQEVINDIYE